MNPLFTKADWNVKMAILTVDLNTSIAIDICPSLSFYLDSSYPIDASRANGTIIVDFLLFYKNYF